ncbi:hypothetical protein TNCT_60101 [Trichonephila clavata]|uniref:Uncharacterized protein n=1 Tax=Trichonephila clavata TaxID=2740835 RepID=A0A8X6FQT8_TRICU|nr:hypothetical protein TNCT_60101 [Trichonephila clavata]
MSKRFCVDISARKVNKAKAYPTPKTKKVNFRSCKLSCSCGSSCSTANLLRKERCFFRHGQERKQINAIQERHDGSDGQPQTKQDSPPERISDIFHGLQNDAANTDRKLPKTVAFLNIIL